MPAAEDATVRAHGPPWRDDDGLPLHLFPVIREIKASKLPSGFYRSYIPCAGGFFFSPEVP
jgi:hypothetical protein